MPSDSKLSALKQISILAELIRKYDPALNILEAVKLAKDIAATITELECYNVNLSRLSDDFFALFQEHWKERTQFLQIVTKHWPDILKEAGGQVEPLTKAPAYEVPNCNTDSPRTTVDDVRSIRNKLHIFEAADLLSEVNYVSEITMASPEKTVAIVVPHRGLYDLLACNLRMHGIDFTSYIDNEVSELSQEFLDEVDSLFLKPPESELLLGDTARRSGVYSGVHEHSSTGLMQEETDYGGLERVGLFRELSCFAPVKKHHKRVEIVGLNEIKFLHHDIIILTELNEDSWKYRNSGSYWLHNSLRRRAGLPVFTAADAEDAFYSCFHSAAEIYMVRALKVSGVSQLKSSILSKFEAMFKKQNLQVDYVSNATQQSRLLDDAKGGGSAPTHFSPESNTGSTQQEGDCGLQLKPSESELLLGDTESRSGVYKGVHEHSSTGSTQQEGDCGLQLKPSESELLLGDTERRSGVYREVHEHSSTGSTQEETDCGGLEGGRWPPEILASDIPLLLNDPQSFYAKNILNISPPEFDTEKRDRARALKKFIMACFADSDSPPNTRLPSKPSESEYWLNKIRSLDILLYHRCRGIIDWAVSYRSSPTLLLLNNVHGSVHVPKFRLTIHGSCDMIEIRGDSVTLIKFATGATPSSTKNIILGLESSVMPLCYIAEMSGFDAIDVPIRAVQIWSVRAPTFECDEAPIDVTDIHVSSELIAKFEDTLYEVLGGGDVSYQRDMRRYDRYRHIKRVGS
ncbi:MAG: hypothetical protein LBJ69_02890 [Holosporales bacterium]|jgi:hypothetical protein|nr:hypothetical protein [Holosporales bacterium]